MEERGQISEGEPEGYDGKSATSTNADVRRWANDATLWALVNLREPKPYIRLILFAAFWGADSRYNWYGLWVSRFTLEQAAEELGVTPQAVRNLLNGNPRNPLTTGLVSKSDGDGRPLKRVQKGCTGKPSAFALIAPNLDTHKPKALAGSAHGFDPAKPKALAGSAHGFESAETKALDLERVSTQPTELKHSTSEPKALVSESAGQAANQCSTPLPHSSYPLSSQDEERVPFDPDAKRELQKMLDSGTIPEALRATTEMLIRGPSNGIAGPGYHGIQISGNWDESYSSYPPAPSGSTVSPSITGTEDFCECVRKMQGGGRMRNEQKEWAGDYAELVMNQREANNITSVLIDGLGGEAGLGNWSNAVLLYDLIDSASNREIGVSLGYANGWNAESYKRKVSASLDRQASATASKGLLEDAATIQDAKNLLIAAIESIG